MAIVPENVDLTEYELDLLRYFVTGDDPGLSWGAAMSVAGEVLCGRGLATCDLHDGVLKLLPTERGRERVQDDPPSD